MEHTLSKDHIIGSTSFKIINIILYFLFSIAFLSIAIIDIPKVINPISTYVLYNEPSHSSNYHFIHNFIFVFPSIIIIIMVAIFLTSLGMFTKANPQTLANILTSPTFEINFILNHNNVEVGIIKLPIGIMEITWNHTSGQFYTWSLLLKITLQDSAKKNTFDLFNKLLIMEKDETDELTYKKVLFARDWPRQEYLLSYWLQ